MSESSANNKRIAKNTIMLYFRMLLMMGVSLYTSRVVLNALGVEDYGIYNVVGGFVAMFGFLNSSMASSTQRYLTIAIGQGDLLKVRKVFSTSMFIHGLLSVIIVVLAESVGVWFFYNKLVIPEATIDIAFWVYQLSILSSVIMIMCVPYDALIIANEKMDIFAYITIFDAFVKLSIAYLIMITPFNRLITYAILLFVAHCIVRVIYNSYCNYKLKDSCKLLFVKDDDLLRGMTSFAGWDLYGNMSVMARTQGVNILLNMFFGAVLNAASGIAAQVQGAVMKFANNVVMAVRPQIIKAYSIKDYDRMNYLIFRSSIFTFLLLSMLSVPIMIETPYILNLWLGVVPEYTIIFTRLTLMFNLFALLSVTIMIGIHATGKIKRPSIINGSLYLAVVPISYICFKHGVDPSVSYLFNVSAVFIGMTLNALTLHIHVPNFSFVRYMSTVVFRAIVYFILIGAIVCLTTTLMEESFLKLIVACFISLLTTITISLLELTTRERQQLTQRLRSWKKAPK